MTDGEGDDVGGGHDALPPALPSGTASVVADGVTTTATVEPSDGEHDRTVVLFVLGVLGFVAVFGTVGTFLLLKWEVSTERIAIFLTLASAAIGNMGGTLTNLRTRRRVPDPD